MPAFSAFTAANEQAIAQVFAHGAVGFEFIDSAVPIYVNPKVVNEYFVASIREVAERWNLDRSESARRVYVDMFIHEALRGAIKSAIVTVEDYVNTAIGNGYIDYIVSAIDFNSQTPVYEPSIVIEAKKGMSDTGKRDAYQWQLLAEMAGVKQASNTPRHNYYGILTDGRYWCFYGVGSTTNRNNQVSVLRSRLYDTWADDDEQSLKIVLGALRKWYEQYGNPNGWLTLFN